MRWEEKEKRFERRQRQEEEKQGEGPGLEDDVSDTVPRRRCALLRRERRGTV